jgi:hypothetical protein
LLGSSSRRKKGDGNFVHCPAQKEEEMKRTIESGEESLMWGRRNERFAMRVKEERDETDHSATLRLLDVEGEMIIIKGEEEGEGIFF